jgi:hypothetical protein
MRADEHRFSDGREKSARGLAHSKTLARLRVA